MRCRDRRGTVGCLGRCYDKGPGCRELPAQWQRMSDQTGSPCCVGNPAFPYNRGMKYPEIAHARAFAHEYLAGPLRIMVRVLTMSSLETARYYVYSQRYRWSATGQGHRAGFPRVRADTAAAPAPPDPGKRGKNRLDDLVDFFPALAGVACHYDARRPGAAECGDRGCLLVKATAPRWHPGGRHVRSVQKCRKDF